MTLDEAIKHCEEKARELRDRAKPYEEKPCTRVNMMYANSCNECAKEHEQLAEWLKDYRRLLTEQQTGEWIDTGDMEEYWGEEFQCSVCGAKDHWNNFCPNCGAKMKGEEE